MQRAARGQVLDLMPARRTGRDDERLRLRRQRRQEVEVGDGDAQVEVLLLVAERAGHAAATGVECRDVQTGDQTQETGCAAHADERLLMAVAVDEALLATRR